MPSQQHAYGGGKFKSERQRRAMWASSPTIARLWAHNASAAGHKRDWAKLRRGAATHTGGKGVRSLSTKSGLLPVPGSTGRVNVGMVARPRRAPQPGRSMGTKATRRGGGRMKR